jgi:hypothetical protein
MRPGQQVRKITVKARSRRYFFLNKKFEALLGFSSSGSIIRFMDKSGEAFWNVSV